MREQAETAVLDFARTMGIENLKIPETGIMNFSFEEVGDFCIEFLDEGVLFYLIREVSDHALEEAFEKSLKLCHPDESRKYDIQCAVKDFNQLVFNVFLSQESLSAPDVEGVLQHLVKIHGQTVPK